MACKHNSLQDHQSNLHVRWDRYIAGDYSQQKTPNESQAVGLLRVVHPQHPLNTRIVKVLGREAGHWIIENPGGSSEKLPLAWAEAAPGIIVQAESSHAWVGVTELLNLVKMIKRLRAQPPEEVDDGNPSREVDTDQQAAGERDAGGDTDTRVGTISGGETPGTYPDPGRNAGQASPDAGGEP